MKTRGQFGTMRNYQKTLNSFKGFTKGRKLRLKHITASLIESYERYLKDRGLTRNSISCYMRVLRAAYRSAVKTSETQIFKNVYTGIDKTPKRACGKELITALHKLDLTGQRNLDFARDLFLFSYCTRGMAFVDMARLKKSDIKQGSVIEYVRSKTSVRLCVKAEPYIKHIIDKYAALSKGQYIFSIITKRSPIEAYKQYQNALTSYNRNLKTLSKMVEPIVGEHPLSSYTARHTWATTAQEADIPLSVISAGLGHTSEKTTQIYLKQLGEATIDSANRLLLESMALA